MTLRGRYGKFKADGAFATFIPKLPWSEGELAQYSRSVPRYQKVLFGCLLMGILLMAFFLFYERKQAHDRLAAQSDATPLSAPASTDTESFTLDVANDGDGSITPVQRQVALPLEPSVRARALLERLMAEYALPASQHPLASGAAVDDVFLLKLPIAPVGADSSAQGAETALTAGDAGRDGELAVINLRSSFVNGHPSGVAVEMSTLLSMIGTIHANFSQITQIEFLVDGQPKETLAGHADLGRIYPSVDTAVAASALQPAGVTQ